MKVIIVGGGVGGCSAALFLNRIGIQVAVYEAYPSSPAVHSGAGLGLAPNGLGTLALYSEEVADAIYARGHKSAYYELRDADGTILGKMPAGREGRYGKHGTVLIRRWDVHDVLLEEMKAQGIAIHYSMRVKEAKEEANSARVVFENGHVEEADLVIGADGLRSAVRKTVSPYAQPIYTGLVGVGGFVPESALGKEFCEKYFPKATPREQKGAIMTFGPLGFFGLAPSDEKTPEDGAEWMWWSTCELEELKGEALATFDHKIIEEKLAERHRDWHDPIPDILEHSKQYKNSVLANYELSDVSKWHTTRLVLLGDAAHVVQPHTGQGVSQAVEDAACLTKFLLPLKNSSTGSVDSNKLRTALKAYQDERKPRVDKILESGRRIGDQKRKKGPIACFFRKYLMMFLLKVVMSESMMDSVHKLRYDKSIFG